MKKRVLSALMVLCMVLTLLPVSAFAAPKSEDTVVRFYVEGTGSQVEYNVDNQPTSYGKSITLKVEKDFALLADSTVTNSTASQVDGTKVEGDTEVENWLKACGADTPGALKDISSLIVAINAEYKARGINTRLNPDEFNDFKYVSAGWIGSNDSSYHVHIKLIRNVEVTNTLTNVVRDENKVENVSASTYLYDGDQVTWTLNITNNSNTDAMYSLVDLLTYKNNIGDSVPTGPVVLKDSQGTEINNSSNNATISVPKESSCTITATFTLDAKSTSVEGYQITNNVTVTSKLNPSHTANASATNPVGYTVKVTYDGNGGTINGQRTKEEVFRQETDPFSVPVQHQMPTDSNGFTYEDHNFTGWYKNADGGDKVTGPQQLYNNTIYFAHWVPATKEIGVNYWDVENNKQAGEGKVTVPADAYNVNTSALTDIPEGYELVSTGDITINDGWIYVEVRPAATTQTVGVNYWDVVNNKQAGEGEVTVAADATNVNSSALTDIPAGYELVNVGDFTINDGWIYVEVRPVATTQTVGVNYWDIINDEQAGEGEVTVAADATNVNSSALTDIPQGYELVNVGDFAINDGWIYVEVRPAATTQTVGVNYWDIVNNEQAGEGEVTVAADATNVNSSALTDIPEGYELVNVGDFAITDGWIYVEVRPVDAETKTVGLNYWDVVNNKQVAEGSVTVAADATNVNTSTFKDIPAGYELVWEGDLQINDGWVWVEVRPVEAPPVEKTFTVTFDSNGGSAVASQTVKEGEKAAKPANPTRDGYTFEGWFADEALKTAYDFNTPVTSDITLYADWDRRSSGGGGGGGSSSTKKYIITVTCGEGGEITPDGGSDNEVEVRKGNDQTFRISADNGYRISDVLVDGESVGNVDKYTFEDVDEDHKIEAIFTRRAADPSDSGTDRYLNTKDHVQYMTGYPDGSFGPGQNMTRAEAAQMFYALLLDQNVPHTVSFSDVPADAWYAEAVNTLASLGMINGYPDGTFRPDAPITRAEFCVIALAFAYEPEDFDCDFRDVSTSDWFYDYVAQATSYGWISGADRSFRPNECITRAEVSVIVNNMLGRVADEDYIDRHEDELNTFPDVKPSHWAYYSIMETANSHDYTKNNGNENWR